MTSISELAKKYNVEIPKLEGATVSEVVEQPKFKRRRPWQDEGTFEGTSEGTFNVPSKLINVPLNVPSNVPSNVPPPLWVQGALAQAICNTIYQLQAAGTAPDTGAISYTKIAALINHKTAYVRKSGHFLIKSGIVIVVSSQRGNGGYSVLRLHEKIIEEIRQSNVPLNVPSDVPSNSSSSSINNNNYKTTTRGTFEGTFEGTLAQLDFDDEVLQDAGIDERIIGRLIKRGLGAKYIQENLDIMRVILLQHDHGIQKPAGMFYSQMIGGDGLVPPAHYIKNIKQHKARRNQAIAELKEQGNWEDTELKFGD